MMRIMNYTVQSLSTNGVVLASLGCLMLRKRDSIFNLFTLLTSLIPRPSAMLTFTHIYFEITNLHLHFRELQILTICGRIEIVRCFLLWTRKKKPLNKNRLVVRCQHKSHVSPVCFAACLVVYLSYTFKPRY